MAAKCSYVEKVGAIYYVRKRFPRAWKGRVSGEVVRLSLRTKDRAQALRWGLEALAVFEKLLRMEPGEALMYLTQSLIDEQLLQPTEMTGADLIRRRALGNVGAKIIRRAREDLQLGSELDTIYRELAFLNRATVEGEAYYGRKSSDEKKQEEAKAPKIDLSGFEAVLDRLGSRTASAKPKREPETPPATVSAKPVASEIEGTPVPVEGVVYTLRYLMADYFGHKGKNTGSDNRSNIERAVKMFEDLCPKVKTLAVFDIPLAIWDELYAFVQEIPDNRGRPSLENLVVFTRNMQAKGTDYPRLKAATLNSNYLGAITRLVNHGNKRRLFNYQSPHMVVSESKRVTKAKGRVPFVDIEITQITSCPIYTGSASRHHRYSPGREIFADDHIYWAPLIAMHTGMRVTEIGLLEFEQLQFWYDRPTLVLELEENDTDGSQGTRGYKTGNAIRRVPVHSQLVEIGFLDFWKRQQELGHARPFPSWMPHIKGKTTGNPEIHYDADFFNQHRIKWGVPKERVSKLTFHSFRGFFIQACHDAGVNPYVILKMVGHDEDTEAKISEVHKNYLRRDLTQEEVEENNKVRVSRGPIMPFAEWLKTASSD